MRNLKPGGNNDFSLRLIRQLQVVRNKKRLNLQVENLNLQFANRELQIKVGL